MGLAKAENEAEAIFRRHRGVLRTSHALKLGIHPRILYRLRDSGRIVLLSRGVFRLATLQAVGDPSLLILASRVPQAVLCLISALSFHGLTTQISHEVYIALPRGARSPRLDYPPIRVFRMSGDGYRHGVETHKMAGVEVQVFGPAKTVADCFKFRNKIGLDVAREALRDFLHKYPSGMDELWRCAKACRVAQVMRPYLEAHS